MTEPANKSGRTEPPWREHFAREGFVLLRRVVPPEECSRFLYESVEPALARAGIAIFSAETWDGGADGTAWGDNAGAVLRAPDGGDHPIPQHANDSRWPALFSSPVLREVLDALHGGAHRWQWGGAASEGVGWIHLRFPTSPELVWRAPDAASGAWHIDGGSDTLDTTQSVVVLPLVTTIRAGGGGTALLAQSHAQVAAFLHGKGERGRRSVDRKIGELVADGLAARNGLRVVEATGAAGDVLVMHPLLVHASSPASRTTLAQSEDGRWACVKHGIRVTFNLSTLWRQPPLRVPADPANAPPLGSLVEQSLVDAVAGARPAAGCVRYGEEVQLRFVASDAVATAGLDGVVRATPAAAPPKSSQLWRLAQSGGAADGDPVRYGDEIRVALAFNSRFLEVECGSAPARVAAAFDGAAPGSCRSYVVEGVCDLRGVALVPGCRIYLRAARPLGNHLHADPEAAAADRRLRAEFCDRGGYQEVALVRPPRTQLSEWLRRGGSSSS